MEPERWENPIGERRTQSSYCTVTGTLRKLHGTFTAGNEKSGILVFNKPEFSKTKSTGHERRRIGRGLRGLIPSEEGPCRTIIFRPRRTPAEHFPACHCRNIPK